MLGRYNSLSIAERAGFAASSSSMDFWVFDSLNGKSPRILTSLGDMKIVKTQPRDTRQLPENWVILFGMQN